MFLFICCQNLTRKNLCLYGKETNFDKFIILEMQQYVDQGV